MNIAEALYGVAIGAVSYLIVRQAIRGGRRG